MDDHIAASVRDTARRADELRKVRERRLDTIPLGESLEANCTLMLAELVREQARTADALELIFTVLLHSRIT